ncbi:MAG: glycerophosphodiester phosphodiesterase [Lachnospiraceae bacterium]
MKTEIFAHRGASKYAPENTMAAFILAHKQGADGIELDVHLTKDGEIVVIHDETINRVSNGKGKIRDYTLEELRKFSFHNHMEEYENVEIPTLREVLKWAKPWNMKVNIELKTGVYWYPQIEEKVVRMVQEEEMEKSVIYSSFNHYSISKVQQLAPEAKTAYLYSDIILNVEKYAKKNGVHGLHPALCHVKMEGFLEKYQKSGLDVRVWTVNKEKDMERLIKAQVTALITNKPDVAYRVRKKIEDTL